MTQLRLYRELAVWWPLFSPPEDYDEEAPYLLQLLREANIPAPKTVVEFGCGGGSIASYLKQEFTMTLVDISAEMLAISRQVNPECEHLEGDMRTARLGRVFDAVFIHDAIVYMTTEEDLRQAIETAFVHCKPGGVAVFVPDCVRETFEPSTEHGGHDGADRSLRYLQWTFDPDPGDSVSTVHFAFLLREGNRVTVEHDEHVEGLFERAVWLRLMEQVGFEQARIIRDAYGRDIFVAKK